MGHLHNPNPTPQNPKPGATGLEAKTTLPPSPPVSILREENQEQEDNVGEIDTATPPFCVPHPSPPPPFAVLDTVTPKGVACG